MYVHLYLLHMRSAAALAACDRVGCADMLIPKWTLFSQTILPLSALFSASLILSNMAYVHLSVSFVQMLKVCTTCVALACHGFRHGIGLMSPRARWEVHI